MIIGNLSKIIYPDNTAVTYAYDANHNLIRVTDWANRVTAYSYDENNRVIGVTKPDGSVTTTVYDNKQRVTSTVERTATGAVITGFEYTYDDLSRIVEEKVLANSTKKCYTYDDLSRVTARTIKSLIDDTVISTEAFTYDAAGNITDAPDSCFAYDTNNRLIVFCGNEVSYDLDGNMLSNGEINFTYDSANRLVSADGQTYTYNAENVRIKNLCDSEETTYVYDTNSKLSKLLVKTTNGTVTKYVYGRGLIGESTNNVFKTYHFDCRGSTIAITDIIGNITDTFAYDTYGKQIARTGTTNVIFGYNGRDGVITENNGLIYMRARYYSPDIKRFINADNVAGKLSNAVTLNRYAYANGNPAMFVDPTGLSVINNFLKNAKNALVDLISKYVEMGTSFEKEIVTDTEFDGYTIIERGTGYSKSFDTGKPINIACPIGENPAEIENWDVGIDMNANGWGVGVSLGKDISVGFHYGDASTDFGIENGKFYAKNTVEKDGVFVFEQKSFNHDDLSSDVIHVIEEAMPYVVGTILGICICYLVVSIPLGVPGVPVV